MISFESDYNNGMSAGIRKIFAKHNIPLLRNKLGYKGRGTGGIR